MFAESFGRSLKKVNSCRLECGRLLKYEPTTTDLDKKQKAAETETKKNNIEILWSIRNFQNFFDLN